MAEYYKRIIDVDKKNLKILLFRVRHAAAIKEQEVINKQCSQNVFFV